ncbi:hypothetical protein BGX26_009587 [Mortierella sp. AD094]|nr:hypothetical protein BGX26_009587 [Mortierella sp. AD094]
MTRVVGSKKQEFERLKRHQEAYAASYWNQLEPEARVCLILNRFTRNLIVMYASSACEKVFHVDPDDIAGKPLLLFIRADDFAQFVEHSSHSTSISSKSTPPKYDECGFTTWSHPRNAPRTALNKLKIFELNDEERVRSTDLPADDPNLVLDSEVISMLPAFKEMIIQDYVDDDGSDDSDDRINENTMMNMGPQGESDINLSQEQIR